MTTDRGLCDFDTPEMRVTSHLPSFVPVHVRVRLHRAVPARVCVRMRVDQLSALQ